MLVVPSWQLDAKVNTKALSTRPRNGSPQSLKAATVIYGHPFQDCSAGWRPSYKCSKMWPLWITMEITQSDAPSSSGLVTELKDNYLLLAPKRED